MQKHNYMRPDPSQPNYLIVYSHGSQSFLLTWTRPDTLQLGFERTSLTCSTVRGGGRVSTSSAPVDCGSPAGVVTERPLAPFGVASIDCNDNSLVSQAIFLLLVFFSVGLFFNPFHSKRERQAVSYFGRPKLY